MSVPTERLRLDIRWPGTTVKQSAANPVPGCNSQRDEGSRCYHAGGSAEDLRKSRVELTGSMLTCKAPVPGRRPQRR